MSSSAQGWLRALGVVLAVFAVGHTVGTASPRVVHGPAESLVFAAMQGFRFRMMGFDRTHWEFYRGFALMLSVLQVVLAVVAWQVGTLAASDGGRAVGLALTLLLSCVGMFVVAVTFFFWGPIVMTGLASVCAGMAVWRLRRME